MPNKLQGTQAIVVCEGRDDYDFARGYLSALGVRRIKDVVSPAGKGAGSAWVRDQFAVWLKAYRAKQAYQDCILVAMIDGDGHSPTQRKRELEHSARMADLAQQPRQPTERTIIVVPTRHIEAWFEFVVGGTCDETEENKYKNRYRGSKRKTPTRWGRELAKRCRAASDSELATWPSALKDACEELARL